MRIDCLLLAVCAGLVLTQGVPQATALGDEDIVSPILGPHPVPGMKYVIVYELNDGDIAAIFIYPANQSGSVLPLDGQAALDITGSPLVTQIMNDGIQAWYVDPITREPRPRPQVPATAAAVTEGLYLIPALGFMAAFGLLGVVWKVREAAETKKRRTK